VLKGENTKADEEEKDFKRGELECLKVSEFEYQETEKKNGIHVLREESPATRKKALGHFSRRLRHKRV